MQAEIELAFQPLLGLPLAAIGRAANLQAFHFGESRTVKAHIIRPNKNSTQEVNKYALHIQCAWRISCFDKIVVGSNDLYDSAEDTDSDDFDWNVSGASRLDGIVATLREEWKMHPPIVSHCAADELGGFRLTLSTGHMIEAFPNNSKTGEHNEHWRLFQPYTDAPHIVVGNNGLEKIGPSEDE